MCTVPTVGEGLEQGNGGRGSETVGRARFGLSGEEMVTGSIWKSSVQDLAHAEDYHTHTAGCLSHLGIVTVDAVTFMTSLFQVPSLTPPHQSPLPTFPSSQVPPRLSQSTPRGSTEIFCLVQR